MDKLKDFLHRHPMKQKELGLDEDHVILIKITGNKFRHSSQVYPKLSIQNQKRNSNLLKLQPSLDKKLPVQNVKAEDINRL